MPTSANILGWSGTEFDWVIQASDIVNEQAFEHTSVNAFGWAGTNFDWAIQASDIVKEYVEVAY
ncbi:hypothetical protein HD554DRAFT_2314981 [Boletus coccyginus]|nr:hypothetical protein HD554DRAFT_2314981 [Boletus coccyginus]